MIDTVVSVKLPIGEMLRIKRNRLMPDHVTGKKRESVWYQEFMGMSLEVSISVERSYEGSKQNFTILRES